MLRIALPLLAVLSLSNLHAQRNRLDLPTAYIRNESMGNNQLPPDVEGSPYYDENFRRGRIQIGDTAYAAMLRYNAYTDQIEMNEMGQVRELLKRDYISAEIGEDRYAIRSYQEQAGVKQGYFLILAEGKADLLLRRTKDLMGAREAATPYGKDQPARFNDLSNFYLATNGEPAQRIRLRKKDLKEHLSEDWGALETYEKKNGLDLKTEQGVIQLLSYYNSL